MEGLQGKITPEVVQSVRDAVDIVEIAGEMTRLVRKGRKYEALCPFHKEKTPSFNVDPDQGLYYCFGCGAGGDAIKLFMQHQGDDFPAAIEALAGRYGIALASHLPSADARRQRQLGTALEAAAEHFRHQLLQHREGRDYLASRDISPQLQERFGIGYAPEGWHHLLDALRHKFPVEDLVEAGLVAISQKDPNRAGRPYDRFRHRLMFPIHTPTGRLAGFGGRTLGDDRAKYINTSETEQFKKGQLLYGFHLAKRSMRDEGRVLLVEGYLDVMAAAACDIEWAVAGMGTALTTEQARLLGRYTDEVVLAYDGDAAGDKAVQRSLPILLAAGLGIRRARFPAGHDPDSLRREEGPEAVREVIAQAADAVQEEIERLVPAAVQKDPRQRTKAASAIAEILQPIRDGIVKHAYGQLASERLGIPLEMLWRRVGSPASPPTDSLPSRPATNLVRSTEEKAIQCLLVEGAIVPPLAELPEPEVFFDPDCRNIFTTFCALYSRGNRQAPATAEVIAALDWEAGSVDKAARLLVQVADSGEGNLAEALDTLRSRWTKQRQVELMRQIKQAQLQNDQTRLAQLLEEKKNLSQSQHPKMTGRYW